MSRIGKTRADWIEAGQALLIEGGIDAVKLSQLTQRLGVTTGSFYHHFRNFDDYLGALADFYGTRQAQQMFAAARDQAGDEPGAILREATDLFGRGRMRLLNIAMRAWAHRDPRAAAAVRRYDEALMRNLDQIFLGLGFDELAAKSRTLILMGLASLAFDPEQMKPGFRERWMHIRELITRQAPVPACGGDRPEH